MKYPLLLSAIIFLMAQSAVQKQYNIKSKHPNPFLFAATSSLFAMFFYLATTGFKFDLDKSYIGYSILLALSYVGGLTGNFLSVKWGPLSVFSLIQSYSLLIPTLYGLLILNEKLSLIGALGIVLLFISIFLIFGKAEKTKVSAKWILSLILAFTGGGMFCTIQKIQQIANHGNYKQEFMTFAMLISILIFLIFSFVSREKYKDRGFSSAVKYGTLNGVANGISNLATIILTGLVSNSILFPTVSAGGIVLGFIVATFIYKEKLNKIQLLGYTIGIASVILLNI